MVASVVDTRVPLVEVSSADVVVGDEAGAAILVGDQVVGLAGSNGFVSNRTSGVTLGSSNFLGGSVLLGGGVLLGGVLLGRLLGGLLGGLLSSEGLGLLGGLLLGVLYAVLLTNVKVIAPVTRAPVETVVEGSELGDANAVATGNRGAAITLLDGVELGASSSGGECRDRGGSDGDGCSNEGEFHV